MDNQIAGAIDVEAIINELRQEEKMYDMADIEDFANAECPNFPEETQLEEFSKDELYREMEFANSLFVVSPEVQLEGKGKFIKRVIRKLSYFIIRQLTAAITEYNAHIVRSLNQIRNYIFSRQAADTNAEELKTIIICDVTSKVAVQDSRLRALSEENLKLKQKIFKYDELSKAYEFSMKNASAEIDLLKVKLEILEHKYQLLAERAE